MRCELTRGLSEALGKRNKRPVGADDALIKGLPARIIAGSKRCFRIANDAVYTQSKEIVIAGAVVVDADRIVPAVHKAFFAVFSEGVGIGREPLIGVQLIEIGADG